MKEGTTHVIDLVFPKDVCNRCSFLLLDVYTSYQGVSGVKDLESIVRESLLRKSIYKATCPLCKQFTGAKSRRSIAGRELPPVLALNTSIYESGMSAQQLWLDALNRNRTYVQPFLNIKGQVDGVDEANEIRYELRVSSLLFSSVFRTSSSFTE